MSVCLCHGLKAEEYVYSSTAGMFTSGGAWIVPCSRPTAKVRALISLVPSSRAESSLLKLIVKVLVEVQILQ